ncbi:MAG: tRNA threonylcarbamoyladenosine dehydratase [Sphingobacteriales bacterium]|jgi:tRNA A37 threonylcarbamoyladenosine dehydratase|nr:tRNA threonylcarbamoyladenosine dehydratase [Sphingobacteriales bacterium]
MEIPAWLSRTELMMGAEKVNNLLSANVLVVGLGGVGGICAEMIARSGVGKMTIVDADIVEASNRNRQIPALISTDGKLKAEVMAARIRDINPDIELTVLPEFLKNNRIEEVVQSQKFDYAVDCIDTLSPKVFFIKACLDSKIPLVSSMGAGGKVDPTKIQVVDVSKTYQCNLARYVRKRLRKHGIHSGFKVAFSPEPADQSKIFETPNAFPKKSVIGTISYMPAAFGIACASVVVRDLINQ